MITVRAVIILIVTKRKVVYTDTSFSFVICGPLCNILLQFPELSGPSDPITYASMMVMLINPSFVNGNATVEAWLIKRLPFRSSSRGSLDRGQTSKVSMYALFASIEGVLSKDGV